MIQSFLVNYAGIKRTEVKQKLDDCLDHLKEYMAGRNGRLTERNNENQRTVADIIKHDNFEKLQQFVREKGYGKPNTAPAIKAKFLDVNSMKIPLIQYCRIQKATQCFKFLLINGIDDPQKTMKYLKPKQFWNNNRQKRTVRKYPWDCMATAIFYGKNEIVKILEESGVEKGSIPAHVEAAILSYRNGFAKEIITQLKERKGISKKKC